MILIRLSVLVFVAEILGAVYCIKPASATVASFAEERAIVNELAQQAQDPESRPMAVQALKDIVANANQQKSIRRYALGKLSAIPEPNLQQYFLDLAVDRFGFDRKREFRNQAILAHWILRLNLTHDVTDQISILAKGLEANFESIPAPGVRRWAAGELCDRGVNRLLATISKTLKEISSPRQADKEIDFCRAKMDVLASYPTRFEALRSITQTIDPREDREFARWAIHELAKLQTDQAEEGIAQYLLRLKKDFGIEFSSSLSYWPFYYLRKFGWVDDDFRERGITPIHWS